MNQYGFKSLSSATWLTPDWATASIPAEEFLGAVFAPQLNANVPQDVCALFEVARGTACYGYFFYPLYSLATEQLSRVADAAVLHRCEAMKPPTRVRHFYKRLKFLVAEGVIPKEQEIRWQSVRVIRNEGSHPKFQQLVPPGIAIDSLHVIAELVNALFSVAGDATLP